MKRTRVVVVLATSIWVASLAVPTPAARAEARVPTPVQADALADSLVANWIDALGGLERYWPMKSARFTVTTEMYDADSGRLRRTRPRYVTIARTDKGELSRIERWEGDDFIQHGWDGDAAWAVKNGEPLGPGDMDYDQARYVSGDVQYWISLPFKLRDDGVNLHYRGRDEEGRHVVGVSFGEGIGLHDGDAWQYRFEEGKTWPAQVAYMEEGRTNWNRLRFEDIREVDGYIFVGRRVYFNELGQVTKVIRTDAFELNPELDLAVFSGS